MEQIDPSDIVIFLRNYPQIRHSEKLVSDLYKKYNLDIKTLTHSNAGKQQLIKDFPLVSKKFIKNLDYVTSDDLVYYFSFHFKYDSHSITLVFEYRPHNESEDPEDDYPDDKKLSVKTIENVYYDEEFGMTHSLSNERLLKISNDYLFNKGFKKNDYAIRVYHESEEYFYSLVRALTMSYEDIETASRIMKYLEQHPSSYSKELIDNLKSYFPYLELEHHQDENDREFIMKNIIKKLYPQIDDVLLANMVYILRYNKNRNDSDLNLETYMDSPKVGYLFKFYFGFKDNKYSALIDLNGNNASAYIYNYNEGRLKVKESEISALIDTFDKFLKVNGLKRATSHLQSADMNAYIDHYRNRRIKDPMIVLAR